MYFLLVCLYINDFLNEITKNIFQKDLNFTILFIIN